jgi:hypothetical protein
MHSGFWWGNLKQRNHLEDLDIDGRININIGNKDRRCEGVDWVRNADTSVILPVML